MIKSYETAKAYLDKGKSKTDRPLPGRSTRLQLRDNGDISIRYHETDVLTYSPDGTITLDSGGWRTVTTKARINEYLPARFGLYQDQGVWYLCQGNYWNTENARTWPFADGIQIVPVQGTLFPNFEIVGAGSGISETLRLKKQAASYATAYVKALFAGKVPAPDSGDCWFCLMRDTETGKTLGETSTDKDHIVSHFEERYYVPSLLQRAMEVFPVGPLIGSLVYQIWAGDDTDCTWLADIALRQLTSSLRRYLYRQLGIAT